MKRILSQRQIRRTVRSIAEAVRKDYGDKRPVLIGVLKGSFIFLADLAREINIPLEVDFVKASSYGAAQTSSGEVRLLQDKTTDLTDRHVLLVEDIADTGLTLERLRRHILSQSPASVRVCALLVREGMEPGVVDYAGRVVAPGFVVGYGIDSAEDYRYLPDIWILDGEQAWQIDNV